MGLPVRGRPRPDALRLRAAQGPPPAQAPPRARRARPPRLRRGGRRRRALRGRRGRGRRRRAAPRDRHRLERPRPRRARAAPRRPTCMVEWVRRLDDFDRKGWHNVCEIRQPSEVEYVGLDQPRGRRRGPRRSSGSTAHLRDVVVDRDGKIIKRNEEDGRARRPRRVLDARAPRRTLDRRLDRAGQRGRAPPRRRDRRLAVVGHRPPDRRGDHRAGGADAAPTPRRARRRRLRGRRAHRRRSTSRSSTSASPPHVLEAAARRAVEAWAEAVDGDDAALQRAAAAGGGRTRCSTRDGRGRRGSSSAARSSRSCGSWRSTPTRADPRRRGAT